MYYREVCGDRISALALGCMRLPTRGGDTEIDMQELCRMVDYAIDHGVNYFDTAWRYHGGASEPAIGKALASHPRESFRLASKFPGFQLETEHDAPAIFEEQLRRCGVEYFDYYLFHNVWEKNIDGFLNPDYGIFAYLLEQKKQGRIRHLGFSTHGSPETMERFLEAGKGQLEFCQIQLNYLDWTYQNAKEKCDLIARYGLPVWVMEPLRGGKLCRLDPEVEARLAALRPGESVPGWAFRFLQGLDVLGPVLSGMSDMEQLKKNVEIFDSPAPLNAEEQAELLGIAKGLLENRLPCTACGYCAEYCPKELDIPGLLRIYNENTYVRDSRISPEMLARVPEGKGPGDCIACRTCEGICPQHIGIADALREIVRRTK